MITITENAITPKRVLQPVLVDEGIARVQGELAALDARTPRPARAAAMAFTRPSITPPAACPRTRRSPSCALIWHITRECRWWRLPMCSTTA